MAPADDFVRKWLDQQKYEYLYFSRPLRARFSRKHAAAAPTASVS